MLFLNYTLYTNYTHYFEVSALLATLELQESTKRKGRFALYNCLILSHSVTPSTRVCSWFTVARFQRNLFAAVIGHRHDSAAGYR